MMNPLDSRRSKDFIYPKTLRYKTDEGEIGVKGRIASRWGYNCLDIETKTYRLANRVNLKRPRNV